jgi:RHS repeat-associated protein
MATFAIALVFAPPLFAQGTTYEGPVGVTGIFNGNVTTGCSYDPLTHSAHRTIDDIIVPGSIGKYPLKMTRYYNSRAQYYALNAIGLSPGWAHEYSWLLWAEGVKVVSPHGNVYDSYCEQPVGVSEGWENRTDPGTGTWRLADGGKVVFSRYRVTDIYDPYGFRTMIAYDANGQRVKVTEPGGRCLWFIYGDQNHGIDQGTQWGDWTWLLTRVEAYDADGSPGTPNPPAGNLIDWVNYTYQAYDPITPPLIQRRQKMLRYVDYSDRNRASYDYRTDNVTENQTAHKMYPVLQRCDDVRYNGPMRTIFYDYQDAGPHGAIMDEKYPGVGAVSAITPGVRVGGTGTIDTFTETRGDGPARSFNYTHIHYCQGPDCQPPCDNYGTNGPDQQMLLNYTDFQNHTTWLHYDTQWYVDRVTDARGAYDGDPAHTTWYERGAEIGQIKKITHQDNSFITYDYEDPTPQNGDPHYVTRITDERGNVTKHFRDAKHRIYRTEYRSPGANDRGALLAYETFSYCDQADSQCGPVNPATGQMHGQIKSHLMKNGASVHYRYDSDGRGLLIDKWEPTWNPTALETDPKTHYTYYPDGNNTKIPWTDRLKTKTLPPNYPYGYQATETYEYDTDSNGNPLPGRGLITKVMHTDGTYQKFGYDTYGNKLWEDNELYKRTSYIYDNYNRLTSKTDPLHKAETSSYLKPGASSSYLHTTGSVYTYTSRAGIVTISGYDENFRKTSSSVAGQTIWFHYDNVGNQDYVTDPRGMGTGDAQYTTYTDYDNRNRKWQVREPLGRTTKFYYDDHINLTRVVRPDNTTETKIYDDMNRLITDTVPKETGVNIVTQFQYNPSTGDPNDSGHSGSLLCKVIDGNVNPYQFKYDAAGLKTKLIYPDNSFQAWAYDNAHNLMSRTTVHNETQDFGYDNRNRKIREWWDGWPADGEWRAFGYDDASHLTLATNGTGAYWTNFIADVRRFYDDDGRLSWDQQSVYVNGIGNTKTVKYPSYDYDGRLTRMYVDGASPAYDYTFSYDDMGRFEKILITGNQNVQFQYSYDVASNETQRYNWVNHIAQNYVPDNLNRMTSVEVKNTNTNTQLGIETYDYDSASRVHTVTREDNKQDLFSYYQDGELNVATYGAAATPPPTPTPAPTPTPGGQVAEPTFNPDGASASACANNYTFNVAIATATGGAQIRYTLDGSTPTSSYGTPIPSPPGTASFTVQSLHTTTLKAIAYKTGMNSSNVHSADYYFEHNCGQGPMTYPLDMAGIQSGHIPMAPDVSTVTYTLDKAGNRTSVNGTSYSPNSINQYTSVGGSAVTNGNEHEIKLYGGFTYYYMRDQELTRVTATNFSYDLAYDALGRCVRRTINNDPAYTTYYIYDGDKPILEYNANGGLVGFNLYGKGTDEILERGANGTDNQWHWYYFQQDHEGSVTHLTDWTGAIIERYRYDAFGAPTIYAPNWTVRTGSSYGNRFLFTGREYDGAWVYEYRARVYHSGLGRFMSEDPKLFDAGDYNLFRYCQNDPIDFTDPMGLEVSFGESLIPVWGSAHMAYDAYKEGHYATAAFHAAMAVTDVSGAKALGSIAVKASLKGVARATAERAIARVAEKAGAEKEGGLVIGKLKDLRGTEGWRKGDYTLNLPDRGSTKQNWKQNSGLLRQEERTGKPIRDRSTDTNGNLRDNTGFIKGERNILDECGRTFDTNMRTWLKAPDATAVERRAVEQSAEKAAEKVSNVEHGLNPKPQ